MIESDTHYPMFDNCNRLLSSCIVFDYIEHFEVLTNHSHFTVMVYCFLFAVNKWLRFQTNTWTDP